MTPLPEEVPRIQARLLVELGGAGGALSLAGFARATGIAGAVLERAVAELEAAGLVELDGAGILRPGRRGSFLCAAEVERSREGRWLGSRVEVLACVSSTNDVALDRAGAGARPGLVVVAELQTKGRGRRGRPFDSRPGLGIWSTMLLRAPADPRSCPRLSLLAALAVARAVETEAGERCGLKWPNDVRIAGKKICGILVEARSVGGGMFPVAGIGVNVHHLPSEFSPGIRDAAGSIEGLTGRSVRRGPLLARMLGELEELLDADERGALDLPALFAGRDEMRDRDVDVRTPGGSLQGKAVGIGSDGSLLLHLAGEGTRVIRSGEATLVAREE